MEPQMNENKRCGLGLDGVQSFNFKILASNFSLICVHPRASAVENPSSLCLRDAVVE
jgi:hypothetical protein